MHQECSFLRTSTDELPMSGNNRNYENGVWFGTPGTSPVAGLDLPILTATSGFLYKGWVIGETGLISIGQFHDFGGRDDFTNFSGTEFSDVPPVPGEDFFLNAQEGEIFPLNVVSRTVVISVEPYPDDSQAPFAMKPLIATAGATTAPATHDFGLNLMSLPTVSVTR